MNGKIPGLHHVTAIASDPQQNLEFYVGLLGLRLVKRTVNIDDPATRQADAHVTTYLANAGHGLTNFDVEAAKRWLAELDA